MGEFSAVQLFYYHSYTPLILLFPKEFPRHHFLQVNSISTLMVLRYVWEPNSITLYIWVYSASRSPKHLIR